MTRTYILMRLARRGVSFSEIAGLFHGSRHKSGVNQTGRLLNRFVSSHKDPTVRQFAERALKGDRQSLSSLHDYLRDINDPYQFLNLHGLVEAEKPLREKGQFLNGKAVDRIALKPPPEPKPDETTKLQRLKSLVRRYAKVDSHVAAHPLVQGFPIETALRHLANDPNNHPSIRELAKVAVTGGKNGDASNVPVALWMLHDKLHEHKHPAKNWYNWMSAADKIGLDAHTYRALTEEAERTRYYRGPSYPDATLNPWSETPEAHATDAMLALDPSSMNETGRQSPVWQRREAMLHRIRQRVKSLVPGTPDEPIDESIRRHAWRSQTVWRQCPGNQPHVSQEAESARDIGPFVKRSYPILPRSHINQNEKATRYHRALERLVRYGQSDDPSPAQVQFMLDHYSNMEKAHQEIGDEFGEQGRKQHAAISQKLADHYNDKHAELWMKYAWKSPYNEALQYPAITGPKTVVPSPSHHRRAKQEFIEAAKKIAPQRMARESVEVGPGTPSTHMSGETQYTHPYEGGVVRVIPRNEGKTLHVDYIGPENASPGQQDQLNTLGPTRVRGIAAGLKRHYPNSQFITGIRPGGRRKVMQFLRRLVDKRRYGQNKLVGSFIDALRRTQSSQQQELKNGIHELAGKLGLQPVSTVTALHDSPNGSIPGVATAIYGGTPEAAHQLAAWTGLTGNLPGMAVFHLRPNGSDAIYKFHLAGSGFDNRAKLDRAGIRSRIMIPARTGFDVLVPDQGKRLGQQVKAFTDLVGAKLQASTGFLKTIGSQDQAQSRDKFRTRIARGESKQMGRVRGLLIRLARRVNKRIIRHLEQKVLAAPNNPVYRHLLADAYEARRGGAPGYQGGLKDANRLRATNEEHQLDARQHMDYPVYLNQIVNGTYYPADIPEQAIQVLERARQNGTRVHVHYGDPMTGKDELSEFEVRGRIGRSGGMRPIPLILNNQRSQGASGMFGGVVRIRSVPDGRELYRHPNYHHGKIEIRQHETPITHPPRAMRNGDVQHFPHLTHGVFVDGRNHANFKSEQDAQKWVNRMGLMEAQ